VAEKTALGMGLPERLLAILTCYHVEPNRHYGTTVPMNYYLLQHVELLLEAMDPGFARWIEVTPPKGLENLAKTWIPTFTRCPAHFLRFRLGKALK
jgi:hypothetical protein